MNRQQRLFCWLQIWDKVWLHGLNGSTCQVTFLDSRMGGVVITPDRMNSKQRLKAINTAVVFMLNWIGISVLAFFCFVVNCVSAELTLNL